ncbi:PIN domain nuclease, a component of toxin-antitoxin system (PIN domain) [Dyadobacter soli]|uniref:PIN domain nuclease, a component of toxin-antitoxin system (PIN domain) n=1 Tax=Dyadobacter soli TaxID=659014 RepID=A0A1G7HNP1_9BACT|nr:type II toxin-antitoxin system VapC family toxin [Dyadobacter soli]SDF01998.1 PIN domain nuclease, a component of toxin-antitoxin system (PIN domain) [Dyadobacter soli]
MKVLLDTHTLIWFLEDSPKLSRKAKSLMEDLGNDVYVHAISWFEMSIKAKIGKLSLADPIDLAFTQATKNGILTIDIDVPQLKAYQELPFIQEHRDPFDRLIIATAIQERLSIVSNDPKFALYPAAEVLW